MLEQFTISVILILLVLPILFIFRHRNIDLKKYLGIFCIYYLGYVFFLFLPSSIDITIPGSSMNWAGKILAIIYSLVVYFVIKNMFVHDYVMAKPSQGSIKKAIWIGTTILGVMCLLTISFSKSKPIDVERLVYQLTMPGLDEELWRGISIAILVIIIKDTGYKFAHPAIWVTTIIFALSHSLYFQSGALGFGLDAFIVSGILGFILGWMTLHCRSIIPALILHNLINFTTNSLEMFIL